MQTYEIEDDQGRIVRFSVDFDLAGPVTIADGTTSITIPLMGIERFGTFLMMLRAMNGTDETKRAWLAHQQALRALGRDAGE